MKKILVLMFIVLFSTLSYSQWWTKGGNAIWPYGDVTISKGNLNLNSGDLNTSNFKVTADTLHWSNSDMDIFAGYYNSYNEDFLKIQAPRLAIFDGTDDPNHYISIGDNIDFGEGVDNFLYNQINFYGGQVLFKDDFGGIYFENSGGERITKDTIKFTLSNSNSQLTFNKNNNSSDNFYLYVDDHGSGDGSSFFKMDNYNPTIISSSEGITFDGKDWGINLKGRIRIQGASYNTTSALSDPPTNAELSTLLGAPYLMDNVFYVVNDTANDKMYYVISNGGSNYFYTVMTKAL